MKHLLTLMILAAMAFAVEAKADVELQSLDAVELEEEQSRYSWSGNRCARVTPYGDIIEYVSTHYCSGAQYSWRGNRCAKVTPYGDIIEYTSTHDCSGARYSWRGNRCAKVTPYGDIIEYVSTYYCN